MDQDFVTSDVREQRPITVPAPHSWDGVGQALRSAYGNYREPPGDMTAALTQLRQID